MKSHLKRLTMPRSWDLKRKKHVFVTRPHPGSANIELSVPLLTLLRDMLKVAKTAKEVRFILSNKEILVNGSRRKETKLPVAIFDVVEIPELKKSYRVLLGCKGRLYAKEISGPESSLKPLKIRDKSMLKKNRLQLNFTDGTNMVVKKDEYKTGDTLIYDFKKKKVVKRLAFGKGALAYLVGGNHVGEYGTIQDTKDKNIILANNDVFETLKDYAFVLGKDKPEIDIEND